MSCRPCTGHVPRVLQFSVRLGVENVSLDHCARWALIRLFGEGWVTGELRLVGVVQSISPIVNCEPSTDSTRPATDVDGHVGTATSTMLSSARRASISKDHRSQVSTRYTKATGATASALSVYERKFDIVHRPKSTESATPT